MREITGVETGSYSEWMLIAHHRHRAGPSYDAQPQYALEWSSWRLPLSSWAIVVSPALMSSTSRKACDLRGGLLVIFARSNSVGWQPRKGVLWVVQLTLRAGLQPRCPKATEACPRRGAELEAMIETRGAGR
jgi:hypothetical protein